MNISAEQKRILHNNRSRVSRMLSKHGKYKAYSKPIFILEQQLVLDFFDVGEKRLLAVVPLREGQLVELYEMKMFL